MRRLDFKFTVSVIVDGKMQDQRRLWAHQQQDPFPGGLRYEATLVGAAVFEHLRGLPLEVSARLDRRTANDFLMRVYIALEAPEKFIGVTYVLNTIDVVRTAGDVVWITGECSPFVHSAPR